jgi:hypothetical protein
MAVRLTALRAIKNKGTTKSLTFAAAVKKKL